MDMFIVTNLLPLIFQIVLLRELKSAFVVFYEHVFIMLMDFHCGIVASLSTK